MLCRAPILPIPPERVVVGDSTLWGSNVFVFIHFIIVGLILIFVLYTCSCRHIASAVVMRQGDVHEVCVEARDNQRPRGTDQESVDG